MNPRVSVIIVGFRSREPLAGCLESLAACRDRLELEVIVVDNASGDGTPEWLAHAYAWVAVIANQENRGFTRGVNQGLARARGDALLVLNPDCEVTPGALEHLLEAVERDPTLAAAAPALLDARGIPARSCGRFPSLWTLLCDHLGLAQTFPDSSLFGAYKYGGRAMANLSIVDWASGAALLLPRAAYLELGGLDENIFMYMEEVDWCRRAARAGRRVRFVPSARIVHFGQLSSSQVRRESYLHNLRSRVYYFRKHHGPLAALAAKGVLVVSLALKWSAAWISRAGRVNAGVYAEGLEAVWAA